MECKIVSGVELLQCAREIRDGVNNPMLVMTLFAGDRLSCCDEGVVAVAQGKVVGLITIAPSGEENSGEPTIVALAVDAAYRRNGIATKLMSLAVNRMNERGLIGPYRIDVVTKSGKTFVDSVQRSLGQRLKVFDFSKYSFF